jgi:corrinoid protein of di/trimethylamine methyltransferase
MAKEKLLQRLSDAVVEMEEADAVSASQEILEQKIDAYEAIDKGLAHGMERAGKLFEEGEYFIPELLICSDAMYAGLDVLKPHLRLDQEKKGKVVIGVVEGDTHDIGKNLVRIMVETGGFEVIDLGRDVSPRKFVDAAKETGADIIAMSTLMTTTMGGMESVINILLEEKIRDRFKVIVGGGPISAAFAKKIGADGYAVNASEAVKTARQLVGAA